MPEAIDIFGMQITGPGVWFVMALFWFVVFGTLMAATVTIGWALALDELGGDYVDRSAGTADANQRLAEHK